MEELKKYATRSIMRFAHRKDKEKLAALIAENFTVHTPTALGPPISFLKPISDEHTAIRNNTKFRQFASTTSFDILRR
jgi:hypothetical protein